MEHSLIYEKGKITITGVKTVDSFDEKEVEITLFNNSLVIRGNNFVLIEMAQNGGKVCFSGTLGGVDYRTSKEKVSFLKRLFK